MIRNASFDTVSARPERPGFSLLEVLVASGILVVGLAAVAALLPAAAVRLNQAVTADRAGALAANAFADIVARRSNGLLSSSVFADSNPRIVVFGRPELVSLLDQRLVDARIIQQAPSAPQTITNLFPSTGWDLLDSLEYATNAAGFPMNKFSGGVRAYREELCWLATLTTNSLNPPSGSLAKLSIAIFKKPDGAVRRFDATGQVGADNDLRRDVLSSCSYVLDLGGTEPPQWHRITASWTNGYVLNPNSIDTRVLFTSSPSGPILAFENLLRVETHTIRLD